MGSTTTLGYTKKIERIAEELGFEVAKSGNILMFGAEKDSDSLSTAACRGAKKAGGLAIGITYDLSKNTFEPGADAIIATGMNRGGGREMALVFSCDAIICVGGGSGTLTEMAVAYQAGIPIIALAKTGGWSEKLAGEYLDGRKRLKIFSAKNPKQAVQLATKAAVHHINQPL